MKKTLSYILSFVLLIPVIYIWWAHSGAMLLSGGASTYISLGRITGLIGVYAMLSQMILVGRVKWLEKIFGLDKMVVLHRTSGFLTVVLLSMHGLFLVAGYALRRHVSWFAQTMSFATVWEEVMGGIIGLALFIFVAITSINFARRHVKYEWWYLVHLTTYLAIFVSFSHQLEVGGDFLTNFSVGYWYFLYAFFLGNYAFYRLIVPIINYFRFGFQVEKVVNETANAVSIYITGKNITNFKYDAGQFAILRFLAPGYWSQAHPFSFSKGPGGSLRFTIKALGDYTSTLKNLKPGTKVVLDGPHGVFTSAKAHSQHVLLIAGGVGVTPLRALVGQFFKEKKNVTLLYGNRNQSEILFKNEFDGAIKSQPNFKVNYILSNDDSWSGEKGNIDIEKIKRLVNNCVACDVYVCGPRPMMEGVIRALGEIGVPQKQIHFEKFAW